MSDWMELVMALGRLLVVLLVVRWMLTEPTHVYTEMEADDDDAG
jgi:hypothetical protein